ncbi:hypothetical protein D9M70_551230 [compost metagenome]
MPQRLALRLVGGDHGVFDETGGKALFQEVVDHALGAFGRIRGRDVDQRVPRMDGVHRVANAGNMFRREFDAEARHQLEAGQRRPAKAGGLFEESERMLHTADTGEGYLMSKRFRE